MRLSWRSGPGLLVDEEVPGFARGGLLRLQSSRIPVILVDINECFKLIF